MATKKKQAPVKAKAKTKVTSEVKTVPEQQMVSTQNVNQSDPESIHARNRRVNDENNAREAEAES